MKIQIYIPPSGRTAEKHLSTAFKRKLQTLTKIEFIRAWCSLAYLYPGLHPDGYSNRGSGWPKAFKPLAAEAWRRFQAGALTDNQLYCYQACKARLVDEFGIMPLESSKKPWFFSDHFAA
jgi:hypothetical protein